MFAAQAIAELGFVVVQFDGRGTPGRNKAFHDHSYGDPAKVSDLSDHVAGIQQLAERYPYLDLDRVGIMSDMIGPGAVWGLLQFPDFYKVGVEAICLDPRLATESLMSRFLGPWKSNPELKFPDDLADRLQGKLLLPVSSYTYGDFNGNVLPSALRLAGAFADANKDIDLSFDPNYAWFTTTYQIRRGWDYLVRHLLGEEPPKNYKLNGTAMWDASVLEQGRLEVGVNT